MNNLYHAFWCIFGISHKLEVWNYEQEERVFICNFDFVIFEKLSDLSLPALLINGDLSHISYHIFIQQMHDQLPNSKRIILQNSGHMLSLENPTQFNNELSTFLLENDIE